MLSKNVRKVKKSKKNLSAFKKTPLQHLCACVRAQNKGSAEDFNSEVLHSEFRFGALRSFVEHQNVEFSHQRLFCKSKMMCFHFVSPSISNVLSRAPILADFNEL